MPIVWPSKSSLRRFSDLLLAAWLAWAVSYLFSALPFGSATTGFMAPLPGPTAATMASSQAPGTSDAPLVSNSLTWDGDCQVVWAILNDDEQAHDLWAVPSVIRLDRAVSPAGRPRAASWGALPEFPRRQYQLRAPPHQA